MLGLHWTPEGLRTDLRTKNCQTHSYLELVGKIVCSSYVTRQVISHSWIIAITRAYSPLKSTSSATTFNCQNGRTACQFHLQVTQIAVGSSFGRKSVHDGHNLLDSLEPERCFITRGEFPKWFFYQYHIFVDGKNLAHSMASFVLEIW